MTDNSDSSKWQPARLIPTSGISGADEQERRAVSALLAVTRAVREFGAGIVRPLGAPAGVLEAFIEVEFQLGDRKVRPDGLIRVSRGQRLWTTLIEVKTGTNDLERAQIEDYLDVAREQGFDMVLTISNQIASAAGAHPLEVDKRKLRKVALAHLSWTELVSLAVVQREHRGVADPDQAWLLGELIRYLEHPKSGALDFSDMGAAWPAVRDAVVAHTLRPSDKGAVEVANRWEQLLTFTALRMERALGVSVRVVRSRKDTSDPNVRVQTSVAGLVRDGRLAGTLRVPGAVGDMELVADLRTQRVSVSVSVDAPRDGRALTRVNWLLRQLQDVPDSLRVDATAAFARDSQSELLRDLRAAPDKLVLDPKTDLRSFRLTMTGALGANRLSGRNGFVDSVVAAVEGFYGTVVQRLRPWAPKAPQLSSGSPSTPLAVATPPLSASSDEDADELDLGDGEQPADAQASDSQAVTAPRPEGVSEDDVEGDSYVVVLSDGEHVTVEAIDLDDASLIAETDLVLPEGTEPTRVIGADGARELPGETDGADDDWINDDSPRSDAPEPDGSNAAKAIAHWGTAGADKSEPDDALGLGLDD